MRTSSKESPVAVALCAAGAEKKPRNYRQTTGVVRSASRTAAATLFGGNGGGHLFASATNPPGF